MPKTWTTLALTGLLATSLSACGSGGSDNGAADTAPSAKYYSELALPSVKPEGLTYVKVEEFADPKTDGQRVQLVFTRDTVYVCSRPKGGTPAGGTQCPYPGKKVFRQIDRGAKGVTVYAVDRSDVGIKAKGESKEGRDQALQRMKNVESTTTPTWFVRMLKNQERVS